MPKIRRQNLPPALYTHLVERVQQLRLLLQWMDTQPEVPPSGWFKRFPGMVVCGEGELIKTFLSVNQTPVGTEL